MDVSLSSRQQSVTRDVGARIRQGRTLRKMSQETLAASLGLSFQQVQKYEKGANRTSIATLIAIAEALNFDLGFFMPSGAAMVGPTEIVQMRADIVAAHSAVSASITEMAKLRDRLAAALDRIDAAPKPAGRALETA